MILSFKNGMLLLLTGHLGLFARLEVWAGNLQLGAVRGLHSQQGLAGEHRAHVVVRGVGQLVVRYVVQDIRYTLLRPL